MHQERILGHAVPGTGKTVDFSGEWINELDSRMWITHMEDRLSGKYESKVSSDGTLATGSLQGFVDGDLVSFVVHWNEFQAITSWTGQCEPGPLNDRIKTLWQMTKRVKSGDEWTAINAGSDIFTRVD